MFILKFFNILPKQNSEMKHQNAELAENQCTSEMKLMTMVDPSVKADLGLWWLKYDMYKCTQVVGPTYGKACLLGPK